MSDCNSVSPLNPPILAGSYCDIRCASCSKKKIATILKQGNDFVIALKGNQGKLMQALLWMRLDQTPQQTWSSHEVSRNRHITRVVRVYACCGKFEPDWQGIRSAICIEQRGTRAGKPYYQRRWFISSLLMSAARFAELIRNHWQIENPLHWVKAVMLAKDSSPLRHRNAAINTSICRNVVINLLRCHGFPSITQELTTLAHDLPPLLHLTQ